MLAHSSQGSCSVYLRYLRHISLFFLAFAFAILFVFWLHSGLNSNVISLKRHFLSSNQSSCLGHFCLTFIFYSPHSIYCYLIVHLLFACVLSDFLTEMKAEYRFFSSSILEITSVPQTILGTKKVFKTYLQNKISQNSQSSLCDKVIKTVYN